MHVADIDLRLTSPQSNHVGIFFVMGFPAILLTAQVLDMVLSGRLISFDVVRYFVGRHMLITTEKNT